MKTETQYVSGYWPLPNNKKKSRDYYDAILRKTLSRLKRKKLIFFSNDSDVLEAVNLDCLRYGISLQNIFLSLEDLPSRSLAHALVTSCSRMLLDAWPAPRSFHSDKGMIHYWRDLQGSGIETYTDMLSIWMSKVALVTQMATDLDADYPLAWVDGSLARIQGNRSNWRFWNQQVRLGYISHYASPMKYCSRALPVSAGFLLSNASVWNELNSLFNEIAWQAVKMPYGHDEETIFGECWLRRPELFRCIGKPYQSLGIRSTLRWRIQDKLTGLLS